MWNNLQRLLRWRRTRRIMGASATVYVLLYLFGIGDWRYIGREFSLQFTDRVGDLLFRTQGPFQFEAIGLLETPWFTLLISPANILVALVLGLLVGLNIAYAYAALAFRQTCSPTQTTSGLLGSALGLFAGTACCGPTLFLILGLQATASVMAVFGWLIPLAFLLLIATIIWNANRVYLPDELQLQGS